MTDYDRRMADYRTAMSLAADMLERGIITEKDYAQIDRIIAKKYGLSLDSICCRSPLINTGTRGNMLTDKKGGVANGTNC